ncbi:hypothetical protein MNB_SV-13-1770 [hydrothermal vent metagenome]|uniref:Uncharacterized protein n=1 Tax=hydrothermal vent metagenome TaxID=652676 RepID=A0A1W1CJ39_9ZZZZ
MRTLFALGKKCNSLRKKDNNAETSLTVRIFGKSIIGEYVVDKITI